MRLILKGELLYVYSGRNILCETHPEEMDPFAAVQVVRTSAITSVKFNDVERSIDIYLHGSGFPIHCQFGEESCYSLNCYSRAAGVLRCVFGEEIDPELMWNLQQRDSETAKAITRMHDDSEYLEEHTLKMEMYNDIVKAINDRHARAEAARKREATSKEILAIYDEELFPPPASPTSDEKKEVQ